VLECYGGTYASHLDGGAIKEWLAYFSAYGLSPGVFLCDFSDWRQHGKNELKAA
jgi:hypothetical protein